ncbi:hypothetical protein AB0L40_06885 [Patulibacter sp. NPDC049589]|uniref:hypothetical protein n=1 Tax=Patulibacter sp. NPDC049589 TaxID=3154731 RepID=UPI003425E095
MSTNDARSGSDAAYDQALALRARGDLAGAEAVLRRADAAGNGPSANLLGVVLAEQGADPTAVIEAFRRAEERGHAPAAFNLAELHWSAGTLDVAAKALERAVAAGLDGADEALNALQWHRDTLRHADMPDDGAWAQPPDGLPAPLVARALVEEGRLRARAGHGNGAIAAFGRADALGHPGAAHDLGRLLLARAQSAFDPPADPSEAAAFWVTSGWLDTPDAREGAAALGRAGDRGHAEGAATLAQVLAERGDRPGTVAALRRAAELGHRGAAGELERLAQEEQQAAGVESPGPRVRIRLPPRPEL